MAPRRRRPWTWVAAAGGVAGALAWACRDHLTGRLPACLFHATTGLHCPGCGGTRSAARLLSGDLPGALAMNPLVVGLGGLAGAWVVVAVWRESRGRPMPVFPDWAAMALVALLIAFSILRNLPWWPFTLLAPH